ncbi:hypothetical protein [Methylobacterium sp. R2-1]|uniref:hypothetical protein n=1 Tax=Methylobacterium sp. R2-1 TaxID=2587064 RepID=UPI0016170B1F|nr:hypothetical protein [Methylobacterium sp. R2-1]MBB2959889.1 hypothetical protein [Methylobacterium sp. R2-1]
MAAPDLRPVRNSDGTWAIHDALGELPGYGSCDCYADALGHIAELIADARDDRAALDDFEAQHFAEAA